MRLKFTIEQANAQARACGMSYGRWEALRSEGDVAAMRQAGMTWQQVSRALRLTVGEARTLAEEQARRRRAALEETAGEAGEGGQDGQS